MAKPYTPIACGLYDQLEIAAMRKKSCRFEFSQEGGASRIVLAKN